MISDSTTYSPFSLSSLYQHWAGNYSWSAEGVCVRISDGVTVPPTLQLVYFLCISTGQAIIVGLLRVCVRISDGPDDGLDITNHSLGTHTIKKNISDRKYALFIYVPLVVNTYIQGYILCKILW